MRKSNYSNRNIICTNTWICQDMLNKYVDINKQLSIGRFHYRRITKCKDLNQNDQNECNVGPKTRSWFILSTCESPGLGSQILCIRYIPNMMVWVKFDIPILDILVIRPSLGFHRSQRSQSIQSKKKTSHFSIFFGGG